MPNRNRFKVILGGVSVAPVFTVAPQISGTAVVGQTLTCDGGTVTGTTPITRNYDWYRGVTLVQSGVSSTYVLVQADAGNTSNIKCVVTATNSAGSASADSNTVAQIMDANANTYLTTGLAFANDSTVYYNGTSQQKTGEQLYQIWNTFYITLKNGGYYSKIRAMWNFGANGATNLGKWNLVDVRDLDAAYRIVFNGTWTHTSAGSTPSAAHANTFFNFNTVYGSSGNYGFANYSNGITTGISSGAFIGSTYIWDWSSSSTTGNVAMGAAGLSMVNRVLSGLSMFNRKDASTIYNGYHGQVNEIAMTFAANPNGNYYIGAVNQNGSATFTSDGQRRFSAIYDKLTLEEYNNFGQAIQDLQTSLGRGVTATPIANFYGDSITFGTGASITANRWTSKLSAAKGWTEVNFGRSGTALEETTPANPAGLSPAYNFHKDGPAQIPTKGWRTKYMFISFGVNDCGFNFAGYNPTLFGTQYQTIISGAIAKGWTTTSVIVNLGYYVKSPDAWNAYLIYGIPSAADNTRYFSFFSTADTIATTNSNIRANPYQYMIDNGGDALLADNLHPNDAGHQVIANYMAALVP